LPRWFTIALRPLILGMQVVVTTSANVTVPSFAE
jgi:hypothetical protein